MGRKGLRQGASLRFFNYFFLNFFCFFVAFGVDEPNSSEPSKGLKEGVFQV